jgi:non-specific serine/threonine protein kinase
MAQQFHVEWRGPNAQSWLERLDVEHDNMRTALSWCTGPGGDAEAALQLAGHLMWFWLLRGFLVEGRAWLARALELPTPPSALSTRAAALYAAGYLAVTHGEPAAARAPLADSLALREQLQDLSGVAMSLATLGYAAYHADDPSRARAYLEQSIDLARRIGDRVAEHLALVSLGQVARREGDIERAIDLNEQRSSGGPHPSQRTRKLTSVRQASAGRRHRWIPHSLSATP